MSLILSFFQQAKAEIQILILWLVCMVLTGMAFNRVIMYFYPTDGRNRVEIGYFGQKWQKLGRNRVEMVETQGLKLIIYMVYSLYCFFFLSNHILLGFIGVRITVMSYIWTIDLDIDNIYTARQTTQNGYFYLHIHKDIFMLWGYGKLTYITILCLYTCIICIYIYITNI